MKRVGTNNWNDEEVSALKRLHALGCNVAQISECLKNRSAKSVSAKLRDLGEVPLYARQWSTAGAEVVDYPKIAVSTQVAIDKLRRKYAPVYNLAEKGKPHLWQVGGMVKNEQELLEMVK